MPHPVISLFGHDARDVFAVLISWPLHKDDTLSRSGRPTGLNIYCFFVQSES
ncbi:hypothetical protein BV22DRAFT_1026353 [Leucogyrophana mollusca]|uniref:Uncharacterized protein n=1 Tax=Leucogyrophana mollusca TaxID=85980 RepID=A0ACB8AW59_9AGAM|nr:hypothetical protein BV22DRAFT_1026353 [Leucogyrophana mollusca]